MALSPAVIQARPEATPSRAQVRDLLQSGQRVPIYQTLLADLETPVSLYLKLAQTGQYTFLLESVEGGEQVGRYSFMGVNPRGIVTVKDGIATITLDGETTSRPLDAGEDPLHVVKATFNDAPPISVANLPRFVGGAVGYISYDVVRYLEALPKTARQEIDVPELAFMLPDTLVIFDHVKRQITILANTRPEDSPDSAYDNALARINALVQTVKQPLPTIPVAPYVMNDSAESNMSQADYEAAVREAKEYIAAGDAFQIVLSQRFKRRTSAPPFTIYRALRATNPSPYMFFLQFGTDFTLMGASPEMMVRLEDGIAESRPIAGTRKRGQTEQEDKALGDELLADEKERAEHVMLVDLGRNDLGRVCDYGTVRVPQMMFIERYSHVMHIVSRVTGKLRAGMDAFDLLRATFPAGTLSGAPKVRAMEIIEQLEGTRRATYGGAVGYFSYDGSMDTCITIRSMLMQGDTVYVQAGAGIVADSDPTREFEECHNKARAVLAAIEYAERGL
ncbi:MAG: anthranilate synthase component I [Phototrophicaceae bacterium]